MSQYYVPCGSDQVVFRSEGNAATLACWSRDLHNYTNAPEISASLDDDPTKVLVPGRIAGHCVRAPTQLPAWYSLRVLQHQLRATRPHGGKDRRKDTGQLFPGPFVRTAGPQGDDHANFVTLIYLLMRP